MDHRRPRGRRRQGEGAGGQGPSGLERRRYCLAARLEGFSGLQGAVFGHVLTLSPVAVPVSYPSQHWDKDVCLNFADRCLSFLKENVDEGVRYSFKFVDPFDYVTLEPIPSGGTPSAAAANPGSLGM